MRPRARLPFPVSLAPWMLACLALPFPAGARAGEPPSGGASLGGMTGLINTPVADVLPDGVFRVGYARVPKEVAYDLRDAYDNEVYSFTLGFLPRVEVMVRATAFPGETLVEGADVPNVDRMVAGRILLLEEGWWPALAAGLDDPRGTRRFHSLYLVAGKTVARRGGGAGARVTLGFGSTAMEARRHVLDGIFGGAELRAGRLIAGLVEYDTEKWNAGVRLTLPRGVSGVLTVLDLEVFSVGLAWTHSF